MILEFSTKLDSDELYCVTKNSHILLISPFLFIFLSLQWKFLSQISQPLFEPEFCVHVQVGQVYCVNEN